KAFMSMLCLRVDWQPGNDRALQDNPIDRELITHIASINHGKGFPTKKEVEAFISMLCLREGWQPGLDEAVQNNPVNRELLMRIASMRHDKGFPTKEQVEAFISMSCLKEGWQPGRDEAVKDKPIDWELLRNIASMNNGKGFPTREQVEAFVSMACLKEGWQPGRDEAVKDKPIDRELLVHIASMNNGRGFPTKRQVEVFMSMSCLKEGWRKGFDEAVQNNPINRELLIYIASICNSRGFPVEAKVIAFVQWLPVKNKKHCLKMASRVFAASGLPEQKELAANERSIRQYLPDLPGLSTESDDDISDGEDELEEDDAMNTLPLFSSIPQKWRMTIGETLKALALFCSAPPKWRMTIAELEQYLTAFTDDRSERTQVLYALASLIPMLFHHGGAGARLWLARHHENQQDQNVLARALSIYAPLDNVKFALTQLPESECLDYITLCRKLNPAPNKLQWVALEPLRQKLNQRCSLTLSKARVLEILWSQPEAKRSGYVEKLDSFFETVPSVRQLYLIHQTFKPQKMQDFLEACIARQSTHTLNVKQQELLLEGLLLAHYYLTDHEQIPDLCFSSQEASADGKGVIINGDALMPGQKRLWYFIVALLIELEQAPEYKFEKNRLTVLSNDRSIVLPKPEFSLVGNGFMIKNWSLEQLRTFFEAKDFTEQWYKPPQDERELYVIQRDERLPRNSASVRETLNEKAKPLAPSAILSIIKSGLPLKPAVWASLEHYANLGQLTTRLCRALAPVIQRQVEEAPESLKNAVTARLTEGTDEAAVSQSYFATAMDAVIDALNRFQVLEETELEMLELFRHQMSPNQLLTVIKKMSDRVDLVTQLDWYKAYEGKKQDLLGLNEWLFEDDPLDE
ncbi:MULTISPECIES: hypothetical protein, partial [unclassified Endozoicomonas]|uniref:hypothetical protein n=1 Tax=unclassified Endozoicomonas TaxID=2644528 RepID=UPI002148A4B3